MAQSKDTNDLKMFGKKKADPTPAPIVPVEFDGEFDWESAEVKVKEKSITSGRGRKPNKAIVSLVNMAIKKLSDQDKWVVRLDTTAEKIGTKADAGEASVRQRIRNVMRNEKIWGRNIWDEYRVGVKDEQVEETSETFRAVVFTKVKPK